MNDLFWASQSSWPLLGLPLVMRARYWHEGTPQPAIALNALDLRLPLSSSTVPSSPKKKHIPPLDLGWSSHVYLLVFGYSAATHNPAAQFPPLPAPSSSTFVAPQTLDARFHAVAVDLTNVLRQMCRHIWQQGESNHPGAQWPEHSDRPKDDGIICVDVALWL